MQKIFFSLICCCLFLLAKTQEPVFAKTAVAIPEELKKDANAVFRLDEGLLEVNSTSDYTMTFHQVVTVLNEQGAHYLHHRLRFDKFYKVEYVNITVFNALGLPTKKYDKKDFEVEAAYDGISLVTDDKVMKLFTPVSGYPCTIEVQYKVHAIGYIDLPNWYMDVNNASTEFFRYQVTVPVDLDIRHRTLNLNITPQVEVLGKLKKYMWEAKNVSAKKQEPNSYEPARYLPQVEVAPNAFEYDGYAGSFKTWKDFGLWTYKLYEEKNPFNAQRISEIQSLVPASGSKEEKISALYQYLQHNMRYVSIQLGIGGFKPFAAKFVDEKRYGDCKALTNYMRYLLQTVGIKSYPALINAGNNKIPADPQFPADPFNHVILCIPGEKDTTWLECTSNNNKAGELGSFTENKRALLLTEEGGVLVNTPKSFYRNNGVASYSEVTINEEGGAQITTRIKSKGEAASYFHYVHQLKEDEQREMLVDYLACKHPDELTVSASDEKDPVSLQVNRLYEKLYNFKAGSKFFFPSCIGKMGTEKLKATNRETDFVFAYPYEKTDTTIYHLPTGFTLETVPAGKEITTEHGTYKRSFSYDKSTNNLVAVSYLALKAHAVPPAGYLPVVRFFKEVAEAEEENIILVKQ